ncbi:glycosyltransferase family 61 protein [Oscillatoria sp. FACHB-1406]|uniref:glycosyltransferase family 61 protein n=1 Tax=Oscillatoria sp. FACHB-1406 TaxID=2692846 RepID=UPI0016835C9E|nr:glycosyltransferase family 61 protein [Oscillatoria sp. FACHB-1406]MBD2577465.1 glycosyltransferase family 61 protein [Oscillatoria sp. FACHB-1406]
MYQELLQPHLISRALPKGFESTVHWKFREAEKHDSPHTFIAELKNARVWGRNGAVITSDNCLLTDVSREFGEKPPWEHSIFERLQLPEPYFLDGTAVVLSAAGGEGYFHWLLEVLPRLHLLSLADISFDSIDAFIVNSQETSYQQETLARLGVPADKIVTSDRFPHLKAERLLVPSLPGITGNPPSWVCEFLRDRFLPEERLSPTRRIYIQRPQEVDRRRVVNEPQTLELLSRFGFEPVKFELLSVAEQARIVASSEAIIGPHGAGLSNLVFGTPKTKVIEVFNPSYVNVCFWAISDRIGADYYYLLSDDPKPKEDENPCLPKANIRMPLDRLEKALEQLFSRSRV